MLAFIAGYFYAYSSLKYCFSVILAVFFRLAKCLTTVPLQPFTKSKLEYYPANICLKIKLYERKKTQARRKQCGRDGYKL